MYGFFKTMALAVVAAATVGGATVKRSAAPAGEKRCAWEKGRRERPVTTDAVLCYGGSHHRTPYRWDKERFTPFVTYVDESGREHWLFDGFLCLEFQDSSRPDGGYYAYMVGLMKDYGFSAGKTQWKELIDYWFAGGSGMDALEGAVKDASARLGVPPSKRKVIMVLPDPIIYKVYDGKGNGKGDPGSTVYWGELNGRKMDFSTAEDRIAAYKWYVDEVRRRFDLGNYQFIDLAGFYIISEELVHAGRRLEPRTEKIGRDHPSACGIPACDQPIFELDPVQPRRRV